MNKKISTKLALGFIGLTMVSSLITGIVYLNIFHQSHMEAKIESLLAYAHQLALHYQEENQAETIALYDQILEARVWILQKDQLPMISDGEHKGNGKGQMKCHQDKSCQVKGYDNRLIREVMKGNEIISKSNTEFYYGKTLSVGVPIWSQGKVEGAVLIHAPLDTVYEPIIKAAWYLGIGIIVSGILTMILATLYARDFTKPIRQMKKVALDLTQGEYQVRTGIIRDDEFGELSGALDVLAIRLEEARLEGEKLEGMRKDFVSNVSHEFRTPLTIIKGNTEALIDEALIEPREAYANILKETTILERLVTDLLDLSRLHQNKLQLDTELISVHEVIRDAVRSIRQVAKAKEIEVTMDLEPYDRPIQGDYLRLRQVFMILLDNSIKYTPEGGSVKVTLKVGEQLEVILEDTGIGIPEEELPYIWERFYKVDKVRGDGASSGIGLAIARSLMTLLAIDVKLESTLGKGTKVTLWIPVVEHTSCT